MPIYDLPSIGTTNREHIMSQSCLQNKVGNGKNNSNHKNNKTRQLKIKIDNINHKNNSTASNIIACGAYEHMLNTIVKIEHTNSVKKQI